MITTHLLDGTECELVPGDVDDDDPCTGCVAYGLPAVCAQLGDTCTRPSRRGYVWHVVSGPDPLNPEPSTT